MNHETDISAPSSDALKSNSAISTIVAGLDSGLSLAGWTYGFLHSCVPEVKSSAPCSYSEQGVENKSTVGLHQESQFTRFVPRKY